jgi:hypothetical protein
MFSSLVANYVDLFKGLCKINNIFQEKYLTNQLKIIHELIHNNEIE